MCKVKQWEYVNDSPYHNVKTDLGEIVVVASVDAARTEKEEQENAKLIAAAPDMLEALQLLLAEFNDKSIFYKTPIAYYKGFHKAEDAINKATL